VGYPAHADYAIPFN